MHAAIRNHDLPALQSILINSHPSSTSNSSSSSPALDLINTPDNMARTPLHLAAWYGYTDIVQYLLSMKASYSSRAKDNFLPLHFAIISSSLESLHLLLQAVPTPQRMKLLNSKITKNNKTALHLAATKMNYDIIKLLLESGCDPLALTKSGQTALDFLKEEEPSGEDDEEGNAREGHDNQSGGRKRKINEEKEEEKEEKKRNYQRIYQLIKDAMEAKIESQKSKIRKRSNDSDQQSSQIGPMGIEATTSFSQLTVASSAADEAKAAPDSLSEPVSISEGLLPASGSEGEKIIKIDLNQRKKKKGKIGVQLSHLENDDDLI